MQFVLFDKAAVCSSAHFKINVYVCVVHVQFCLVVLVNGHQSGWMEFIVLFHVVHL